MNIKNLIKRVPVFGPALTGLKRRLLPAPKGFSGSQDFWISRYAAGGDSGEGSYNELAEFKAEVLNDFVQKKRISSVIEFGCGDGNQLRLAKYPKYLGVDISPAVLERCRKIFSGDSTKTFQLMDDYKGGKAECALSLDVIYHLIEDEIYFTYMRTLFSAAEKFVVIYSSNRTDPIPGQGPHERQRRFTDWVERNCPGWELINQIKNRFPMPPEGGAGSMADFYMYERR